MRRIAAVAALGALALVPGTQAGPHTPVLATLSKGMTSELVRVDPATLHIEGRRLELWRHDLPWTRSPDGSRLALGSGRARSIRLVDVRAWRRLRDVRFRGSLVALAWPESRRLLTVIAGRCCPSRLRAVAFDPESGRPVVQRPLGRGTVLAAVRTARGLALLLGPPAGIRAPRLVTLDADARARSLLVAGVEAGWRQVRRATSTGPSEQLYRTPGLAVDAAGDRALVVGASSFVLVDLRTGRREWRPFQLRSLADGGFSSGSYRRAAWIARNLVAVTGYNNRVLGKGASRKQASEPAGLSLIDIRTLAPRIVDPRASTVTRAGRLLLATDGMRGAGLTAYGLDGRLRFRTLGRTMLGELPIARGYAYVGLADQYRRHTVRVLDVAAGRVVRTVEVPGMLTLLTEATPRVCWC